MYLVCFRLRFPVFQSQPKKGFAYSSPCTVLLEFVINQNIPSRLQKCFESAIVKKKKFALEQAMKAQSGSKRMSLLFNFSAFESAIKSPIERLLTFEKLTHTLSFNISFIALQMSFHYRKILKSVCVCALARIQITTKNLRHLKYVAC
jgi:hypothetical protein